MSHFTVTLVTVGKTDTQPGGFNQGGGVFFFYSIGERGMGIKDGIALFIVAFTPSVSYY